MAKLDISKLANTTSPQDSPKLQDGDTVPIRKRPVKNEAADAIFAERDRQEEARADAAGDPLPPTPREDNRVQRTRRIKRIITDIAEGIPAYKACKLHGTNSMTFWKWMQQSPAWKSMLKRAQDGLTDRLKDTLTMCALKAPHDPKYQRTLEFALKIRLGIFDKDKQIVIQQADPTQRKVEFVDIAASDRKPPPSPDEMEEDAQAQEEIDPEL